MPKVLPQPEAGGGRRGRGRRVNTSLSEINVIPLVDVMGQLDRARESWETLLKTFPDAEVARLGKQNLDRIARAKPRG